MRAIRPEYHDAGVLLSCVLQRPPGCPFGPTLPKMTIPQDSRLPNRMKWTARPSTGSAATSDSVEALVGAEELLSGAPGPPAGDDAALTNTRKRPCTRESPCPATFKRHMVCTVPVHLVELGYGSAHHNRSIRLAPTDVEGNVRCAASIHHACSAEYSEDSKPLRQVGQDTVSDVAAESPISSGRC